MKSIPEYKFHKTKYGESLLLDVVSLDSIRKHIDKHPVHTLTYYDITFITKGFGSLSIGNNQYSLKEGDVLFSKPKDIRAWDKTNLPQGYALIFEEEFLLSFFNDSSFLQNLSYFNRKRTSARINISQIKNRIDSLIQNIIEEINNIQSKDKHILRALLYEMLVLLNREYLDFYPHMNETAQNRHADNFIALADKYFSIHHDTKYYADKLCITPNYLNEVVKKSIGTSPKAYIQNKIIQEAKTLLSYTYLSVSEISNKLNFESSSYFIRLFRKKTNCTPLQYRQSINR